VRQEIKAVCGEILKIGEKKQKKNQTKKREYLIWMVHIIDIEILESVVLD
jgi:hypothetical protein